MTLEERFWAKVDTSGDCWLWTAARMPKGYGLLWYAPERRTIMAHRVAWIIAYGEIPDGMEVLHRCDNPPCVRLDHLFLGTQADNVQDMLGKGRGYLDGPHQAARGSQHGQAKVTEAQVVEIRTKRAAGVHWDALRGQYGLSETSLANIVKRKTWQHVA